MRRPALLWLILVTTGCAQATGQVQPPITEIAIGSPLPAHDSAPLPQASPISLAERRESAPLEDCIAEVRSEPFPGDLLADDASLYRTALRRELDDDGEFSREHYQRLIHEHSESRYVPLAYFAYGEQFRQQASQDASMWPPAQRFYEAVFAYPESPVFGLALLRSADLPANVTPDASTLATLKKAVLASERSPCKAALRSEAVLLLAHTYATTADPRRAAAFFSSIQVSPPITDEAMRLLLDVLERAERSEDAAKARAGWQK